MTCHCIGCNKTFVSTQYYEHCDDCNATFQTKETPVPCPKNCPFCYANKKETAVIDDSNCHCGPCTAMNEPLTLEGDIRYLKAHIETKNRQLAEKDNALAEAKLRIDIYREAWADTERENARLREKVDAYNEVDAQQVGELNDFRRENARLREENERLNTHKARYQQEITDIEADYEKLFKTLQGLRNTLQRCSDDIYSAIMVD